ncbi:MAG: hypothetical protein LKF48_07495 [Prevotella sp.]|jgi:hypothetical protein|nr:hypothetical protein [Prevotella sp.]MCH4182983.1 hypothetical protein [Prevotella sp.]
MIKVFSRVSGGIKVDDIFVDGVSKIGTISGWSVSNNILQSPLISSATSSTCTFSENISVKTGDVIQIYFNSATNNGYKNKFNAYVNGTNICTLSPNNDSTFKGSIGGNITSDLSGKFSMAINNANSTWEIQVFIKSIKIIRKLN